MPANIAIEDDIIDENNEQIFIAHLEVVNAVNFDLIRNDALNTSMCFIVDDDGKFLLVVGILRYIANKNE